LLDDDEDFLLCLGSNLSRDDMYIYIYNIINK
jgi:hypothetical protein